MFDGKPLSLTTPPPPPPPPQPMVCELPIAMLACARIGAIHSVVFGGFSSDALASRIKDCKSRVVITCNGEACTWARGA